MFGDDIIRNSRSQRIKEHRINRMQRASDILEGKSFGVNMKLVRRNQVIMYAVIILLIFSHINTLKNSKVFSFDKDVFVKKYESFINKNKEKFIYDKSIESIIKNKTEYSIVQKTSLSKGSLIAIYEQGIFGQKIKRLGVVGKYKEQADFDVAYIENMAILIGVLFDKDYNKSLNMLKDMKIIDDKYKIIYRKSKLIVNYEDVEINFFSQNDKIIFSIENKSARKGM